MATDKAKSNGARRKSGAPASTATCTCGKNKQSSETGEGVGPGAHAAGVDRALKTANLKHLKRIEGQVRGIAAMIEEDRYCADIIQQCAAVQESLRSVAKNLYRNHLRHCALRSLHNPGTERDRMVEELLDLASRLTR
ncbi:MAG TPA: metal-sensitive transcriptional regulator [Phycisphaerales bacterium]|nr:metal-sensitive transcriptional regulator [Phycisphaerales bacterium]